jgi:hypothetical protein
VTERPRRDYARVLRKNTRDSDEVKFCGSKWMILFKPLDANKISEYEVPPTHVGVTLYSRVVEEEFHDAEYHFDVKLRLRSHIEEGEDRVVIKSWTYIYSEFVVSLYYAIHLASCEVYTILQFKIRFSYICTDFARCRKC